MANSFEVDQLRREIEALVRDNPELAEDEVLRADMLDGQTDFKGVLRALFEVSATSDAVADVLGKRILQLSARRTRFKQRVEAVRGLMLKVLQAADLKKVELPEATISQREGQPQIVGEPDVNTLPNDLVRTIVEPNRVKIREALLNGQDVPGLFLSNAPPSLTISVR
jgi:hypothetical protein